MGWMPGFIEATLANGTVAAALVLAVGWLARTAIAERLKGSVQHEFKERLEAVKADFKEREARLQADLKAQDTRLQSELRGKDQQLQLLQSGVLSARAARQTALNARRLDAIDALWASFNELAPLRVLAQFMQVIKYDAALTHAAGDEKTRSYFAQMAKVASVDGENLKALAGRSPWKARLYVSDEAWRLFKTYQGVLHVLLMRLKQLESGLGKDFTKVDEAIAEVKAALPHHASFLDEDGGDRLAYLVTELGEAFERELMSMLRDEPRSEDDLQQAGILLVAAEKLIESSKPST